VLLAPTHSFDPRTDNMEKDLAELLSEGVGFIVRNHGSRLLSVSNRKSQVEGILVKVFRVLFGTGALHKSYVSA